MTGRNELYNVVTLSHTLGDCIRRSNASYRATYCEWAFFIRVTSTIA